MKNKSKTIFVCSGCGGEHMSWAGKCSYCGEWNTLKELKVDSEKQKNSSQEKAKPVKLSEIKTNEKGRIQTGISELDLVLGGGLVPGEVLLLGGNPGVGKSTLVWQAAANIKEAVVYIAGEESPEQIKLRAKRLSVLPQNITIVDNNILESWIDYVSENPPALLIVDSIQTVQSNEYPASLGSIIQVKECAMKIIQVAKKYNIAVILVGHVTKEGEVAGPRTLEHLVDAVFYLEGEKGISERFLRAQKNRFGPTDEVGLFKITASGLSQESDFGRLSPEKDLPSGVCRVGVMEGSRVYFTEIQALVQKSQFGFAKRNAVGYDLNRLQMMAAIISRHTKIDLTEFDIFLNTANGYKLRDPIADLAVLMALASSAMQKPLSGAMIALGEVDLAGRIHLTESAKKIIKTAQKIGYKIINPKDDLREIIRKYF